MTQFEYVSVAVSLVYALAFSRLLGSALAALRSPARYSVHAAWMLALFLIGAFSWWRFWTVRDFDWSGPLFAYALLPPAIISLLVSALIGDDAEKPRSYRDVFVRNRVLFFGLYGLLSLSGFLGTWLFDLAPWFKVNQFQLVMIAGLVFSAAGIALPSHRAQVAIVTCVLIWLFAGFLVPLSNGGGG